MDTVSYVVALVTLEADDESPVYLTNRQESVGVGGNMYLSSPAMEIDIPSQGGDVSGAEGSIKALAVSGDVLSNMAGGYPYNRIKVDISEAVLDYDLTVLSSRNLFRGLVYQSAYMPGNNHMELTVKDWKYYMDTLAGVVCSEQCYVSHFGDQVCQATVQEFSVTITLIIGNVVEIDASPVVADFLFNKGYFKYKGTSIKIKYWESGTSFQTSEPMPSSWQDLEVTLVAGCDKLISTCRDIHDNEEHFSGWGYNMVDYNSQTEDG